MHKLSKEAEQLTMELVNIPSVNGTEGEKHISNKIFQYLKEIDYFKKNPQLAFQVQLKNDALERSNVFALLRGEKGNSNKTIILHGHIDTVNVDDFGNLLEYAFNPEALEKKLKEISLPKDVSEDLESGDWMFGRGTCDMKSGDAVHLVILKELSKRIKEIEGNILYMANPVEENQHTGIIEALDVLNELQEKFDLEYVLAINNDYICPMYDGDKTKYIYTGAVGKLLPSFYIVGKETHVGQCFEGLNPNTLAGEIINQIDLNADLCDEYGGEVTLPPSVLKFKDLKDSYNVQIPFSAFAYFNYAVHNESPEESIKKLKNAANIAFEKTINRINDKFRSYCLLSGYEYKTVDFKPKVVTYSELYESAKLNFNGDLDREINDYIEKMQLNKMDLREISMRVVEKLFNLNGDKNPCVVIFFCAPYCPHNTLKQENIKEKEIIMKIEQCTKEMNEDCIDEDFKIMKFFPSLSDSSYLKIDDNSKEINYLTSNFPGWNKIYEVPLEKITKLNIPAINYGCYGKDAHKWTERVYKPYTFNILPELIMRTIKRFLV